MDALIATQNKLITFLQDNQFEHLSKSEQTRLRDYLQQILNTLEEAADRQRMRQTARIRERYLNV